MCEIVEFKDKVFKIHDVEVCRNCCVIKLSESDLRELYERVNRQEEINSIDVIKYLLDVEELDEIYVVMEDADPFFGSVSAYIVVNGVVVTTADVLTDILSVMSCLAVLFGGDYTNVEVIYMNKFKGLLIIRVPDVASSLVFELVRRCSGG